MSVSLQRHTPRIAVVVFEGISPFHLAVPCVVFGEQHPGCPPYDLRICAQQPGTLRTSVGLSLVVTHGLRALATADMVIVPSWPDAQQPPPAPLLRALVRAHARGACVVGLCTGAYVLAAAGLLDHREATTHWSYAQDFAQRFPRTRLKPDSLYVDADRVVTSAGTAAAIDCCLHLLRQRDGAEVATAVARRLVVAPHRSGGQSQFVERPMPTAVQDLRLSQLMDDVRAHPGGLHTLQSMAARAHMSRRTFSRRFRQITGTTPLQWLLSERLLHAQRLLETHRHPVDEVARLSGIGSPVALRTHFKRAFGVPPSAWREAFRA